MKPLQVNIIAKELEGVPDNYLADILNFIEFIKSSETASQATNNEDTKSKSEAYATTHPAMPEYIIVHNHLN
ncbi:MAG: hypothetical protein RLZZ175_1394 [Bacteroidota bacterium]|jgi:hypothetical protein